MVQDELTYTACVHVSGARDALQLVQRGRRAHVRIESARRCGHEIYGNGQCVVRIGGLQGIDTPPALHRSAPGSSAPGLKPPDAKPLLAIGEVAERRPQKYFGS